MLPGQSRLAISSVSSLRASSQSFCDLLALHAEDADHAAGRGVGGVLHRAATLLHDAQARFEIHHAGEHQGRVLAEAQAGRRRAALDQLGRVLLQLLQRGEAGDEQRRLAVHGRIELLRRAFGAELVEVVAEHLGRAIEQRPCRGHLRAHGRAHADGLSALAGEEKGDFAGVGGHGPRCSMTNDECRMTNERTIRHSSFGNSSFLLLRLDHRAAGVVAAVRADHVRRFRRAALRAGLELLGFERVVRATHAGAGIRVFAFWNGHRSTCARRAFRLLENPPAYGDRRSQVKAGISAVVGS